ncbi:septal ring lytic transglycosylase RlpA family protein [Flavobacterium ardleyense]|uniref:Septal ring lytic transglycosylase RlpA family protein n=1 Tax=Flavobacterium ardleyense TaxID=2038737 RepID=A0ABW5Z6Y1_9FLAO
MKKNVIILSFALLITMLLSFSHKNHLSFERKAFLSDTVKKKNIIILDATTAIDSIKITDSIATLETRIFKSNVEASHYSDKLNGRRTASGKIFNNKNYTAAHKTLKFGTKVKVTNIVNNKSVIVTITDRGPFTKNREIDIAKTPFLDISHNSGRGLLRVNLEVIQ